MCTYESVSLYSYIYLYIYMYICIYEHVCVFMYFTDSKAAMIKDIEIDLENKRYTLQICQEKLAESSYMKVTMEVENLESQLVELEEVLHTY
jgi:hypothetical protein